MTRWTNWGGSIVTFIAVTVILLAGLVGSIYLLNQRTQQAVNEETTASQSEDKKNSSETENETSPSETKKEPEKSPENGADGSSGLTTSDLSQAGYLPQTGSEFSWASVVVISFLTYFSVSFIRSRG